MHACTDAGQLERTEERKGEENDRIFSEDLDSSDGGFDIVEDLPDAAEGSDARSVWDPTDGILDIGDPDGLR